MKYGKAVIVGRPNTGKSTLINAIMQQKISITSPLPQTTRRAVRGVYSDTRGKIVITDTPGIIQKVEGLVSKRVNREAPQQIIGADVVVCLVDISRPKSEEENKVIGLIRKSGAKKILVYNKIDLAKGSKDYLPEYNYLEEEFDQTIAISAIKGKNVKGLINLIFDLLPEGTVAAEDEEGEETNWRNYVSEIIREKAYLFLREEVPYSINVEVDSITDKTKIVVVGATIYTNNDRYKKMIIGAGGKKIREIGYNARKELELMSDRRIYLELTVAVDKHWMERVNN